MVSVIRNDVVVEILATPQQPEVIGWGFGSVGDPAKGEADQVQRWLLAGASVEHARKRWAGGDAALAFRAAKTPPWDTIDKEADFIAAAKSMFASGDHVYAKANCRLITGVPTIPKPIPVPGELLPPPGGSSQIDVGTSQIRPWPLVLGDFPIGYVSAFQISTRRFEEYWVLLKGYVAVPAVDGAGALVDQIKHPHEFASLFDQKLWDTTSTLAVCNVGYYENKFPDPG